MLSKNTISVMRGAALWAVTFASVVTVATIWSAAFVSFSTTDYAYPRTGGATNLNATMWNKLIDNVQDIGLRTSAITVSSWSKVGIWTADPSQTLHVAASNTAAQLVLERIGTGSGKMAIGADSSGFSIFEGVTYARRLTVTASWSVGIGTANPVFKLDVNGSSNAASQCIGGTCLSAWSEIAWGSYTTATTKCAAVNNPATWSTTCPSGFSPVITGRGLCDQSDPAFSITYLCVKN